MGVRNPEELSLEELEALLLSKRRQMTQIRLRRIAEAEAEARPTSTHDENIAPLPPRSPETWRGAGGRDRYFRGARLESLVDRTGKHPTTGSIRRTRRDWALLLVEVGAFVGLVIIMAISYQQLQALNQEYRVSQQARLATPPTMPPRTVRSKVYTPATTPTLTPMTTVRQPTVTLMLSPEGGLVGQAGTQTSTVEPSATLSVTASLSTTPTPAPPLLPGQRPEGDSVGNSESSEGVASLQDTPIASATPRVTAAPGDPVRIVIPAIEVDAPVVQSDDWDTLKLGVGHRLGSGNPGEPRNVVLSAHNDVYGEIFRRLHELKTGDEVRVYTADSYFDYVVDWVEIVLPTRIDLIEPGDRAILTLVTCYPYLLDTHRVVVRASLVQ